MKFRDNLFNRTKSEDNKNKEWPQILTVLIATLTMLSCGMFFSWPSIAILHILSHTFPIDITIEQASYFSVIQPIAAILTSPLFAYLTDKIGRKPLVIFINVPYLVGWIMIGFSNSIYIFYLARLIGGLGDAAFFTTVPTYIGEVCEPKIRGTWGNALTFQLYLGQLLMNVLGTYFQLQTVTIVCGIIPVIGLIIMPFLPESPYYLLMKNQGSKARKSLQKLRGRQDVDQEFIKLTSDVQRQTSERGTFKDLFVNDANRSAFFVANGLRIAQQFSGISAFFIYAQYIFELANSGISKTTSVIIFTGAVLILNFFSSFILDRLGRKISMIASCAGSAIALTIEGIYFYCKDYTSLDTSLFGWIPLSALLLYVVFYSVGLGIAPTLMLGELFSTSIKGKALCALTIVFSICLIATTKIFQVLVNYFGLFAPFTLFAVSSYIFVIFSYLYVPETKGKTLEEIQQILKGTAK